MGFGFVEVDSIKEEQLLVLFKSAEACISSVESSELGISDYDLHVVKQYNGELPF